MSAENELRELLHRVLDAGMERWHDAPSDVYEAAPEWLGLTREEYAAWVEMRPPFVP